MSETDQGGEADANTACDSQDRPPRTQWPSGEGREGKESFKIISS